MRLTRDMIFELRSERGGWNYATLSLLGVKTPPEHGWIDKIVETEIDEKIYDLTLRVSKLKGKRALDLAFNETKTLWFQSEP